VLRKQLGLIETSLTPASTGHGHRDQDFGVRVGLIE
jgi:hypothetical protein